MILWHDLFDHNKLKQQFCDITNSCFFSYSNYNIYHFSSKMIIDDFSANSKNYITVI